MLLIDLLKYAVENNCSDIHLSTNSPPIFRMHGEMKSLSVDPMTDGAIREMLYGIMNEKQKQAYIEQFEIDFSTAVEGMSRFRVNAFNTINGAAAVFRIIPTDILTLEQLKTPHVFERFTMLEKGLVLVTGPTGSGKSTTLAAMINHINMNYSKHIITVEDPVEFVHKSKKCLINQREVGASTPSFARALKSSLREDPDVILVGELRDIETMQLAITAAETGHLVFATLHTSSAPQTVDRIIDVFPTGDKPMIRAMLSNSLEAVISQKLLPKIGGKGRIACHEIMICNSAIRNLIRESKTPQMYSMIQIGIKSGMKLMKDSVMDCVNKGLVSLEDAEAALNIATEEQEVPEKKAEVATTPKPAETPAKPVEQSDF